MDSEDVVEELQHRNSGKPLWQHSHHDDGGYGHLCPLRRPCRWCDAEQAATVVVRINGGHK